MLIYYYGKNTWQLNQDKQQLKQHFFSKNSAAEWNYYQIDSDQLDQLQVLKQLLLKQPFMSKTILIILMEPSKEVISWIATQMIGDDLILAIFDYSARANQSLVRLAGKVVERKLPTLQEMLDYLKKYLPNRSGGFYQDVLNLIAEFDSRGQLIKAEQYWKFRQELDKIQGYSSLEDYQVVELIAKNYYGEAFGLIKALNQGNREQVSSQLALMDKSNQDWYQTLGLLIWYILTLVKLGFVEDRAILDQLGVKGFNQRQYASTAKRLGQNQLKLLLVKLIKADRLHKSSSVDIRLVVEKFAFEFHQILQDSR